VEEQQRAKRAHHEHQETLEWKANQPDLGQKVHCFQSESLNQKIKREIQTRISLAATSRRRLQKRAIKVEIRAKSLEIKHPQVCQLKKEMIMMMFNHRSQISLKRIKRISLMIHLRDQNHLKSQRTKLQIFR
jgi:hypothetical protein